MGKSETYRLALRELDDWEPYLLAQSGLPGPRANLELAFAAAKEGTREQLVSWLTRDAHLAPANQPAEFLPICGTLGLGRLLAEGDLAVLPSLRACANDPRWRLREAAAMALQCWGEADLPSLLDEMERWAQGSLLERRAAAAALCEPSLLSAPGTVLRVLAILDRITASFVNERDRRAPEFVALKKGLSYCWSVAVAAHPGAGKQVMEKWIEHPDAEVRRVMRENLTKARLKRMDPAWVEEMLSKLS